jgi:hypothetical protein
VVIDVPRLQTVVIQRAGEEDLAELIVLVEVVAADGNHFAVAVNKAATVDAVTGDVVRLPADGDSLVVDAGEGRAGRGQRRGDTVLPQRRMPYVSRCLAAHDGAGIVDPGRL